MVPYINIHISPKDGSLVLNPPTSWSFQLSFILSLKIFAIETPRNLGISSDHPWGRYGYFLELQIHFGIFTLVAQRIFLQ